MDLDEESINQRLKSKFKGKEKLAEQNKFLVAYVGDLVREEHGSPTSLRWRYGEVTSLTTERIRIIAGSRTDPSLKEGS